MKVEGISRENTGAKKNQNVFFINNLNSLCVIKIRALTLNRHTENWHAGLLHKAQTKEYNGSAQVTNIEPFIMNEKVCG